MQLGSGVAVVQAGSCNSDSTPSLGTSICRRCLKSPQKKDQKEKAGVGLENTEELEHVLSNKFS